MLRLALLLLVGSCAQEIPEREEGAVRHFINAWSTAYGHSVVDPDMPGKPIRTAADLRARYGRGERVVIAVVGDSCSYDYADGSSQYTDYMSGSEGMLTQENWVDNRIRGWPTRMREFLQRRNPSSQVYNLSGGGYNSSDHLGITAEYAVEDGHESTFTMIGRLKNVDAVFLAATNGDIEQSGTRTLATFQERQRDMVDAVLAMGKLPVLYASNPPGTNPGGYDYFDSPDELVPTSEISLVASEYGIEIINGYEFLAYAVSHNYAAQVAAWRHPSDAGHMIQAGFDEAMLHVQAWWTEDSSFADHRPAGYVP